MLITSFLLLYVINAHVLTFHPVTPLGSSNNYRKIKTHDTRGFVVRSIFKGEKPSDRDSSKVENIPHNNQKASHNVFKSYLKPIGPSNGHKPPFFPIIPIYCFDFDIPKYQFLPISYTKQNEMRPHVKPIDDALEKLEERFPVELFPIEIEHIIKAQTPCRENYYDEIPIFNEKGIQIGATYIPESTLRTEGDIRELHGTCVSDEILSSIVKEILSPSIFIRQPSWRELKIRTSAVKYLPVIIQEFDQLKIIILDNLSTLFLSSSSQDTFFNNRRSTKNNLVHMLNRNIGYYFSLFAQKNPKLVDELMDSIIQIAKDNVTPISIVPILNCVAESARISLDSYFQKSGFGAVGNWLFNQGQFKSDFLKSFHPYFMLKLKEFALDEIVDYYSIQMGLNVERTMRNEMLKILVSKNLQKEVEELMPKTKNNYKSEVWKNMHLMNTKKNNLRTSNHSVVNNQEKKTISTVLLNNLSIFSKEILACFISSISSLTSFIFAHSFRLFFLLPAIQSYILYLSETLIMKMYKNNLGIKDLPESVFNKVD